MRLARLLTCVVVAAATVGIGVPPAHAAGTPILGGGSGFAALEIDQWRADTARSPFNLNINYVAQGSSFGRQQFSGGTFDYGASDIQYVQLELPDLQAHRCAGKPLAQCFVYVPVSAGGLAFMYNLNDGSGRRVSDLRLTRQAACKMFTGAITKWNDPEIVATNPRLASINRDIHPVIRADGAGESYVFSEFCSAVAPGVWSAFITQQRNSGNAPNLTPEFIAGQPTSVWPQDAWGANPVPIPYADGVANYVADPVGGANSITYVAAGYAKVRSFPTASLQNAARVFTQPDEANVTVALGYATPRGNGTFKLAFNGPDPRAYFPSTYSYVLAQTGGFDAAKGATLARFLCYAVSQGQVIAPQLRYARLSTALVNIAIAAIIQIPGALSKGSCFVAGAPPPPPPPTCAGCLNPGGPTDGGSTIASGPSTTVEAGAANATGSPARKAAAVAKAARAAARERARTAAAKSAADETAAMDARLALLAGTPRSEGHGVALVWIFLAGVVLALAVTVTWSIVKKPAR